MVSVFVLVLYNKRGCLWLYFRCVCLWCVCCVCAHACTGARMHACVCVCVWVCTHMGACMYVCVCVCGEGGVHAHVCVCILCVCFTIVNVLVCAHVCMCVCVCVCVCSLPSAWQVCLYVCACVYVCVCLASSRNFQHLPDHCVHISSWHTHVDVLHSSDPAREGREVVIPAEPSKICHCSCQCLLPSVPLWTLFWPGRLPLWLHL